MNEYEKNLLNLDNDIKMLTEELYQIDNEMTEIADGLNEAEKNELIFELIKETDDGINIFIDHTKKTTRLKDNRILRFNLEKNPYNITEQDFLKYLRSHQTLSNYLREGPDGEKISYSKESKTFVVYFVGGSPNKGCAVKTVLRKMLIGMFKNLQEIGDQAAQKKKRKAEKQAERAKASKKRRKVIKQKPEIPQDPEYDTFAYEFSKILAHAEEVKAIAWIDKKVEILNKEGKEDWIKRYLNEFYPDAPMMMTPLIRVCRRGLLDLAEKLMTIGANVNLTKTGKSFNTTLHYVVKKSIDIKFIHCLFRNGAKIDALDNNKKTALYYAIEAADMILIKLLVEDYYANTSVVMKKGKACKSAIEVVEQLKNKALESINTETAKKMDEIMIYFTNREKKESEVSTETLPKKQYFTYLINAIKQKPKSKKTLALLKFFHLYNRDIDYLYKDKIGNKTLFGFALRTGDLDVIQKLLELGADPNKKGSNSGPSPLHVGIRAGNTKAVIFVIKYFLKEKRSHTLDLNIKSHDESLLFHAIFNQQLEIIKALVKAGVPLGAISQHFPSRIDYKNPLEFAKTRNNPEIINYFKENFTVSEEDGSLVPISDFSDIESFNEEDKLEKQGADDRMDTRPIKNNEIETTSKLESSFDNNQSQIFYNKTKQKPSPYLDRSGKAIKRNSNSSNMQQLSDSESNSEYEEEKSISKSDSESEMDKNKLYSNARNRNNSLNLKSRPAYSNNNSSYNNNSYNNNNKPSP